MTEFQHIVNVKYILMSYKNIFLVNAHHITHMLTGTVSGFLLSQQMVQYYVLNFLILWKREQQIEFQWQEAGCAVGSAVIPVPIYLPCCIIGNIIYIASEKKSHKKFPVH